jgi:hypothetical protein
MKFIYIFALFGLATVGYAAVCTDPIATPTDDGASCVCPDGTSIALEDTCNNVCIDPLATVQDGGRSGCLCPNSEVLVGLSEICPICTDKTAVLDSPTSCKCPDDTSIGIEDSCSTPSGSIPCADRSAILQPSGDICLCSDGKQLVRPTEFCGDPPPCTDPTAVLASASTCKCPDDTTIGIEDKCTPRTTCIDDTAILTENDTACLCPGGGQAVVLLTETCPVCMDETSKLDTITTCKCPDDRTVGLKEWCVKCADPEAIPQVDGTCQCFDGSDVPAEGICSKPPAGTTPKSTKSDGSPETTRSSSTTGPGGGTTPLPGRVTITRPDGVVVTSTVTDTTSPTLPDGATVTNSGTDSTTTATSTDESSGGSSRMNFNVMFSNLVVVLLLILGAVVVWL